LKDNPSVLFCQIKNAQSSTINENLKQPCQMTKCQHHIFYEKIFNDPANILKGQPNHLTPHENELSRSFNNCMLQLYRALTLEEIGEMYGCAHQTIVRIISLALKHINKNKGAIKELKEHYNDEKPDLFYQMKHRIATQVIGESGRGKVDVW
jgi:hypothetical protein